MGLKKLKYYRNLKALNWQIFKDRLPSLDIHHSKCDAETIENEANL